MTRPPEKFVVSNASIPQVVEAVVKHIHDNRHAMRQMLSASDPNADLSYLEWLKLSIKEIRARIDQSYGDPGELKRYYDCLASATSQLTEFGKSIANLDKVEGKQVDVSAFED